MHDIYIYINKSTKKIESQCVGLHKYPLPSSSPTWGLEEIGVKGPSFMLDYAMRVNNIKGAPVTKKTYRKLDI